MSQINPIEDKALLERIYDYHVSLTWETKNRNILENNEIHSRAKIRTLLMNSKKYSTVKEVEEDVNKIYKLLTKSESIEDLANLLSD